MARASSRITLVLVGKTGHGKSATGNSLLGANVFESKSSFGSITSVCNLKTATLPDGREIHVIDTPGLCDTQRSAESINNEISNCLVLAKDGVNALVLVLSSEARFTEEEIKAAESMHLIFGKEVMKYVLVVFTRGDQLDDGQTLDKHLDDAPPFLHKFLRKCNGRKVLFNNKTTDKQILDSQRTDLIRLIDSMVRSNGGQPYTCEALKAAQDHALKMEQEKSRIKQREYEQEMSRKIEEITQSNARMNEATLMVRLGALEKYLAEMSTKMLQQNKEAYDRELEILRTDINDARAENAKLKQKKSGMCTIS